MKTVDLEQGSLEWLAFRAGKVSASRMGDLMAKTKSGYGASRGTYMGELIAERLTGRPLDSFKSAAMIRGTEMEPKARLAYELETGHAVEQVGCVVSPKFEDAIASPDGLIDGDGLCEIKCPELKKHINTILTGTIDKNYHDQMQWQMYCCDRSWCDFVSFDDRMPSGLQLYIQRIPRDPVRARELVDEVGKFLEEMFAKLQKLQEKLEAA